MDNNRPAELPPLLEDIGPIYNISFEKSHNSNFDFFAWKALDEDTYWQAQFPIEFQETSTKVKRCLENNYDLEWHEFVKVLVTTAHLVALASRKYSEEPFENTTTHTRPDTSIDDAALPPLHYVPFGENFFILCNNYSHDYSYRHLYKTVQYIDSTFTAHPSDNNTYVLPTSIFHTSIPILLEALSFLVHIGFVSVHLGKVTGRTPIISEKKSYNYIVSLLLDNTIDCSYGVLQSSPETIFFRVGYNIDIQWSQFLTVT